MLLPKYAHIYPNEESQETSHPFPRYVLPVSLINWFTSTTTSPLHPTWISAENGRHHFSRLIPWRTMIPECPLAITFNIT